MARIYRGMPAARSQQQMQGGTVRQAPQNGLNTVAQALNLVRAGGELIGSLANSETLYSAGGRQIYENKAEDNAQDWLSKNQGAQQVDPSSPVVGAMTGVPAESMPEQIPTDQPSLSQAQTQTPTRSAPYHPGSIMSAIKQYGGNRDTAEAVMHDNDVLNLFNDVVATRLKYGTQDPNRSPMPINPQQMVQEYTYSDEELRRRAPTPNWTPVNVEEMLANPQAMQERMDNPPIEPGRSVDAGTFLTSLLQSVPENERPVLYDVMQSLNEGNREYALDLAANVSDNPDDFVNTAEGIMQYAWESGLMDTVASDEPNKLALIEERDAARRSEAQLQSMRNGAVDMEFYPEEEEQRAANDVVDYDSLMALLGMNPDDADSTVPEDDTPFVVPEEQEPIVDENGNLYYGFTNEGAMATAPELNAGESGLQSQDNELVQPNTREPNTTAISEAGSQEQGITQPWQEEEQDNQAFMDRLKEVAKSRKWQNLAGLAKNARTDFQREQVLALGVAMAPLLKQSYADTNYENRAILTLEKLMPTDSQVRAANMEPYKIAEIESRNNARDVRNKYFQQQTQKNADNYTLERRKLELDIAKSEVGLDRDLWMQYADQVLFPDLLENKKLQNEKLRQDMELKKTAAALKVKNSKGGSSKNLLKQADWIMKKNIQVMVSRLNTIDKNIYDTKEIIAKLSGEADSPVGKTGTERKQKAKQANAKVKKYQEQLVKFEEQRNQLNDDIERAYHSALRLAETGDPSEIEDYLSSDGTQEQPNT